MTEPAYTEQDLKEAQNNITPFDAGLLNNYGGGKVEWWWDYIRSLLADEEAHYKEQCAAEFSRIRSEARAGMREACAKAQSFFEQHSPILWEDSWRCRCSRWALDRKLNTVEQADKSRVIHLAEEWEEHIRSLPDLAADEAIERIKAEAERKGRLDEAKWWHPHDSYHHPGCVGCKRIAFLEATTKEKP